MAIKLAFAMLALAAVVGSLGLVQMSRQSRAQSRGPVHLSSGAPVAFPQVANTSPPPTFPAPLPQQQLKQTLRDLSSRLEDPNPNVRMAAARTFGELGYQAEPAVSGILRHLADPDSTVRIYVADALGRIGAQSPGVVAGLLSTLRRDHSSKTRAFAAMSLGKLLEESAADALASSLEDPSPEVRSSAADALREIGVETPRIVMALVARLGDDTNYVQASAFHALQQMGSPQATAAATAYENARSAKELEARARRELPGLLHGLNGSDPHQRASAIDNLAEFGSLAASASPILADLVLHEPNKDVWRNAARALGSIGVPRATISRFLQATRSPDPNQRLRGVVALEETANRSEEAVPVFLGATRDADELVRFAASEALAKPGPLQGHFLPALLRQLEHSPDEVVQTNLQIAIGNVRVPEENFLALLRHPKPEIVTSATSALVSRRDTTRLAVDALTALLRNPDPTRSAVGAMALEGLGSVGALEALRVFRGAKDIYGPEQERLELASALGQPNGRKIALAVIHQRFRPAKSAFTQELEWARLYERQEVWVYSCDVPSGVVRHLASIPAPWVIRNDFHAVIRGWENDAFYLVIGGRQNYITAAGDAVTQSYKIKPDGTYTSVGWVPGTARRPPGTSGPDWNERNYMRVDVYANDVKIRTEPAAEMRTVFRLDGTSGQVVAVHQ